MEDQGSLHRSRRARAARVSVTVYGGATLASLLFFATLTASQSRLAVAAGFATASATIACASICGWAGRTGRDRILKASLLLSLLSFEAVAGLFAAQFGGLSGVGIGVLIASWSAAEWLAPRRPWLVALGVVAQTLVFVAVVSVAAPHSRLAAPELALMATGMILLTAEASSLGRRDTKGRSIWRALEQAHRQLERRRTELAGIKDGLRQRADKQLAEILAHAKTSEQLDGLLASHVAGRSRALVREVDRRSTFRSDALAEGATVGPARVLGRITPGPYQRCYLASDVHNASRRLLVDMVHSADAHARVTELNAAIHRLAVEHPSIARIESVVAWSDEDLAVISEQAPGRLLIHAVARPDLSWRDAVVLGQGLAEALAVAHASGCLHLGLDPYRIVLRRRGSGLTIYGLGLIQAWHISGGAAEESEQLLATPAYRSPDPTPSAASDVYSLGVILFELISKFHPFVARVEDDGSNAAAVLHGMAPEVDGRACELVQRMLSSDPQSRPSMSNVATALLDAGHWRAGVDVRSICERFSTSQHAMARVRARFQQRDV